jgi:uncharacterized protein (DUF305 family)
METKLFITGFVALLIGVGIGYALAKDAAPAPAHTMDGAMTGMTGMTAGLEGKRGADFDHAFIDEMIVHHEGAVAMAEAALEYAEREEVKNLAREIIEAQTREIGMMRGWMEEWFGAGH